MTLSGKSDGQERIEAGRRARQERATQQQQRKPWLMPLIIGIAVAVLVVVFVMIAAGLIPGL